MYIASEREVAANAYFVLLRLSADPIFMSTVEEAICGSGGSLKSMLDAAISQRYFYNFTVYLDDVRPLACLACAEWRQRLASVARPWGYGGAGGVEVAAISAVLSDGTRVRLELSLGRP